MLFCQCTNYSTVTLFSYGLYNIVVCICIYYSIFIYIIVYRIVSIYSIFFNCGIFEYNKNRTKLKQKFQKKND